MFQQGQQVIYGMQGVCNVLGVENRVVNRTPVEYYVLEPVKQPGDRFYVPTQNPTTLSKVKPILTKVQIDNLLADLANTKPDWNEDENCRKQMYRELISSGDRATLLATVRDLYIHKQQQEAVGRKMHLCDVNFMHDAENLLNGEFSIVLGIAPGKVAEYIQNAIFK